MPVLIHAPDRAAVLARWLRKRGIEAHVIHASSVAVSREHRRAKTDRLDTELLKRTFLGWLRGERDHCKMVAIPTIKDEDAKRPNRERESLVGEQNRIINRMKATLIRLGIRGFNPKLKKAAERLEGLRTPEGEPIPPELHRDMVRRRLVSDQIRQIENVRLEHLKQAPSDGPHAMVRLLARVIGVGIETADMLVQEVLSRNMRDRRAVARYAGLTGSPDESGTKRREKGLARSGNARVRRGMIQLAWRFLMFQKNSALAQWFQTRTKNARGTRKPMVVALARKLLIALWRFVREGVVPDSSSTERWNDVPHGTMDEVSPGPEDPKQLGQFGAICLRAGSLLAIGFGARAIERPGWPASGRPSIRAHSRKLSCYFLPTARL